ncbi:MAG TPA: hypothetical protein VGM10_15765 [Actinocrinis sp.]
MSRVGGQLAVGQRREPDRLGVYFIDAEGVLCELRWDEAERGGAGGALWRRAALPRGDGLPFGTLDHPPGSLATGYQRAEDRLEVFAVDRDGMLRVFTAHGERHWESDVVPEAVGIPPGACLATGFERDHDDGRGRGESVLLDVFTTGRAGQPLIYQVDADGKWRAGQLPYDAPLPYGANLATGYRSGRRLLTVFAVDREGSLVCMAQSAEGKWRADSALSGEAGGAPLPPGAPLAVGYPDGGEPSVFVVDQSGRLREFQQERSGRWADRPLPADGMPPLAAVAVGYCERPELGSRRQLLLFAIDEVGRLRQYANEPGGGFTVGVVPGGLGLPAGAPLAVGYRDGGARMDVFVLDRYSQPPLHYSLKDGGWTGPHPV